MSETLSLWVSHFTEGPFSSSSFPRSCPSCPLPSQKTLNPTILSIFPELYLLPNNGRINGLIPFIVIYYPGGNFTELAHLTKSDQSWVKSTASRCKIVDDLIMYSDVLMDDPNHLHIFVPSNIELQCHLLHAYHDSSIGMHHGCDATYNSLSHDFYWRHMHKHVRNWVRRCPQCICFKSLQPSHGPMQLRLHQHPFRTLGVDYVGELPPSPSGNKWILTAVCNYSNYLRAIPVPDKTATTAANALFHVFVQLGFPSVLQSDHGGEFLNALLHRITQLLSIKQVFTSGFRPRLNGTTERSHWFLNSALGIFCEHQQEKWEQFLQPAVYSLFPPSQALLILHLSF